MRPASPLALGIGIVLLLAGVLTLVRALKGAGGSEGQAYGLRIVGMMLTAGGLALIVFTLALGHWS
ncbi:hypothetical protein B0I00_1422 [Novosphingobium kunmingense]|uniref:Uncharacterized protein n=1 Tax=Novosphingobium kunmingense TaxID=1211806 RepID=A0A2N0HJS4_9SPHN|nr:hypothetical protein [Novosphingobium kunmingense]PKB19192.1 hypothetical protein B0I00_1422 [Novosphingobium kunmingense]